MNLQHAMSAAKTEEVVPHEGAYAAPGKRLRPQVFNLGFLPG